MCGRYILVTKVKKIEKRFNVKAQTDIFNEFEPNVNIGPGSQALAITDAEPKELQMMTFGFTPFWAKKRMYIFNARSEGDRNKENDPNYTGAKEIFKKPMFRHAIRSKRCLIIADGFLEGPEKEKLSKPHVVYLRDRTRPFAFAGLWDEWVDESTAEVFRGFAIITTVSNAVTQAIGHHRSPVILSAEHEETWLDSSLALRDALELLNPYPAHLMNAYPIAPGIKHPGARGLALIDPIGQRLFSETRLEVEHDIELFGMGMTHSRKKRNEENQDNGTAD